MAKARSGLDSVHGVGADLAGDSVGVPLFPVVAGNPWYSMPSNFRTVLSGTGAAAGIESRQFKVSSGTDALGYGTIQSFRSLNFRTGISGSIRVSGRFPNPVAGTWSGIGGVSVGDEVSFGYDGTTFGVWHRWGGCSELRTLTVTAGAGGSETLTLTLNSVAYSIPLTSGSINYTINEIVDWMDANQSAWSSQAQGETILFASLSDAPRAGTYSFSSTGTAAGTIAQTTAGITKEYEHVPMANWNGRKPSEFDPECGNNYIIDYEAGHGDIAYKIREHATGHYTVAHVIRGGSLGGDLNMGNPCLPVGCYAYSVGGTTSTDVFAAYLSAFTEAVESPTRNPRAAGNTKSVGTTLTNILTIRNRRSYGGFINQGEIEPLVLTLANDGTKTAVFQLRANPTVGGTPVWTEPGTNLISDIDTAGTTVTEDGRDLDSFVVARQSSIQVDLQKIRIRLPPTLRLVVAGQMASGASADLSAALTWYEDVG